MRGSNGVSEPLAASVESAPVTRRRPQQRSRPRTGRRAHGGRELRAVQQRQTFLGAEHKRLPSPAAASASAPGGRRRHDLTDADHRGRHVGQGRQVARCTDRTLTGTTGSTFRANIASAADSFQRTPEEPCARLASLSAIISRTIGAGIASPTPAECDSTMLRCKLLEVAGGDADAGELAEAGVDAVDRLARARMRSTAAALAAHPGRRVRPYRRAAIDRAPIGEPHRPGADHSIGLSRRGRATD